MINRQAVIITREKENMKPTPISHYPFDPLDPLNRGVQSDEMAGYTHAYLRRIVYLDPASEERFVFITTDHTLRPGLIALLYFLRWKIEKTYDVTKNRLHLQKAWANGEIASLIQAHFAALTHNLLTLLLSSLEDAGVHESKLLQPRTVRNEDRPASQRTPAHQLVRHAAQLTCQFIRLVRHYLTHKTSCHHAFPLFKQRLGSYL